MRPRFVGVLTDTSKASYTTEPRLKPIKETIKNNTEIFTSNVPKRNVATIHMRVVIRSIGFLPCEPSDLAPTQGPRIATITIAPDVANPNDWSVHPCSVTSQTEK